MTHLARETSSAECRPEPPDQASMTSFLISLLRDWDGWRLAPAPGASSEGTDGRSAAGPARALLPLDGGRTVEIGLAHVSLLGHHGFVLPAKLREADGSTRPLATAELVALASEAVADGLPSKPDLAVFLDRVAGSLATMRAVLEARRDEPAPPDAAVWDFASAEQAVLLGHPVHPTPKSRAPFTEAEAERYSPEFATSFPLRWLAVRREALAAGSSARAEAADLVAGIALADPALGRGFLADALPDPSWALMPAHPWQADRMAEHPDLRRLTEAGMLRDLGQAGSPWRPTSSLRTLHSEHASFMVKVSLSVRLTNSLRVLQPKEVARGPRLERLFQGPYGDELRDRCPGLNILAEPAHLSLKGADGRPLPETTVVLRENPFRGHDARGVAVLSALYEARPHARPALAALVEAIALRESRPYDDVMADWFDRFLAVAVEPLILAQAQMGILFSAHLQNTLLRLEQGRPAALFFRDCQGSGFSPLGRDLVAAADPGLAAELDNVFDTQSASRLLGYYLVVNTVFSIISALAGPDRRREAGLAAALRGFLLRLAGRPLRDRSFIDYLLASPVLWTKANFRICLAGLDETTAAGSPLDGYVTLSNPIAGSMP